MKRILFLLGIGFFALAFLGAALEVAARAMSRDMGWLPSIAHVWGTLSPDSLNAFEAAQPWIGWQIMVEFPAVVVFGIPAFILILVFRNREDGPDAEHEASLFLFDELAQQAQEENFENTGDDTAPGNPDDLHPADSSYAEDFSADDVTPDHDFLLGSKPPPESQD